MLKNSENLIRTDNDHKGGSKPYFKSINIDHFSENSKEIISNENIKTIFISTSLHECVYITAFKDMNIITVSFRGTSNLGQKFKDAQFNPIKCNVRFGDTKKIDIKVHNTIKKMVDSTINTLIYSIIFLAKEFLEKGNTTIYTFGHSLGGGLSTYFAFLYPGIYTLIENRYKMYLNKDIICISNSAPRILNKSASEAY